MKHRFSTLSLVALFAIVVSACSSPASTQAPTPEPTEAAATETPEATETAEATEEESEGEAAEERVRIDGSVFEPAELTIAVGTEVTFLNADTFGHTVTEGTDGQPVEDPIVDEELDRNGATSVTFDEPGTSEITCRIHPSMQMTIIVEG